MSKRQNPSCNCFANAVVSNGNVLLLQLTRREGGVYDHGFLSPRRIEGPWTGTPIIQRPYQSAMTISVPCPTHTISNPYDKVSTVSCLLLSHFTGVPFTKATILLTDLCVILSWAWPASIQHVMYASFSFRSGIFRGNSSVYLGRTGSHHTPQTSSQRRSGGLGQWSPFHLRTSSNNQTHGTLHPSDFFKVPSKIETNCCKHRHCQSFPKSPSNLQNQAGCGIMYGHHSQEWWTSPTQEYMPWPLCTLQAWRWSSTMTQTSLSHFGCRSLKRLRWRGSHNSIPEFI